MLRLESVSCGYGPMQVVHGLDLNVAGGEIFALLGANGAGKSSTIMCIAGHVAVKKGRILYQEKDITKQAPMVRVRNGVAVVPEGRRLFPNLTVMENLVVGGYCRPKQKTPDGIDRIITVFPRLGERLDQIAGSLSGGEQQMLSIGRALMSEPKLLLVDELSLGLMPKMIDICYQAISDLKEAGLTFLLVEQSTQRALDVADRVLVLESGRTVWKGTAAEAKSDTGLIDAFLGLHARDESVNA